MSLETIINDAKTKMLQSVEVLKKEYSTMRTSRATPSLLSRITVNQYGQEVPLQHVASVSAPDPKSLVIQPWDKTVLNLSRRGGRLVASFPVEDGDELLLMSDGGQVIRTRVDQIRIAGRNTQGVTIFRTAEGEKVVSVERLAEPSGGEAGDDGGESVEGGEA